MKIILDTNILISALIKDSITRRIIVDSEWEFYYPETSLHEIRKYKDLILKKSGLTDIEFIKLFNRLFNYIKLIPEEVINLKLEEAYKELGKIDPDDVVFLATALSLDNSVIWSDDAHFDKQDKVKIIKTKNIADLFFFKFGS